MSGILQTLFLGAAAAVKDAYFNLVTLLLNTTATNGAQNNTFLDSSTNNFSITRNGNTTQGTFTPFSQTGWGMYLNGSSYVQTPSGSLTNLTGGQLTTSQIFTVEAFINIPETMLIAGDVNPSGGGNAYAMNVDSSGYLNFGWWNGSSYTTRTGNVAITFNQWNHVAWVINAGTVYFYVNGSAAGSNSIGNSAETYGALTFGGYNNSFKPGYYSNLRVTKAAVYSGAYTVPTANLLPIASTTLLIFQNNRFKDNSANNYVLTLSGSPSIQAFSPFAPSYTTPTTYSNWFDGSGDYLTVPNNAAFDLGSGDATIEAWICPTSNSQTCGIFDKRSSGANYSQFPQIALNSGALVILVSYNGSSWAVTINGATPAANTWSHIALVRNGNIWTLYVNGSSSGTPVTASGSVYSSTDSLSISASTSGGLNPFSGCISNARIVKGTAVYTANFTPPTAPLTAISGTSLLTCQNSTFIDNSTNAFTISAFGNAQPVASPTPFAPTVETENADYDTTLVGGSAYFDGTGDWLSYTMPAIGTGNFTIEGWVYLLDTSNFVGFWSNFNLSTGNGLWFGITFLGTPRLEIGSGGGTSLSITGATALPKNTWIYVAARRNGSAIDIYVNGVSVASGTSSSNLTNTSAVIGRLYTDSASSMTGYISNLRVSNIARTISSPPTSLLTNDANTQLLTNFTNAGIYDATAKNDLETVGNAQVSTTQAKWGTTSMYFDGSGDNLIFPSNQLFNLASGDFTIEFWFYPPSVSYGAIMYSTNNGSKTDAFAIYSYSSGQSPASSIVALATASGGGAWSLFNNQPCGSTIAAAWQHVAVVRNGSTFKGYLNGVAGFTVTSSSAIAAFNGFSIASNGASGDYLTGYIDDLRITKYARYTTNFTPPTTAFPIQ